jgi:DNA-binding transcriptional ArsR family regulator
MSMTATNAAWEHIEAHDLSAATALVLLALARRHNQETGRCDPSITRIAADTGLSERAVRNGLRSLEELRLIVTVFRKATTGRGKKNMTSRYRIKGGAKYAGGVGQNMPPKREYKPSAFDDLVMSIEPDPF